MLFAVLAVLGSLVVLLWSADRFVLGSAAVARHFGMPSLLIGMVVVGFGTSAPEMLVSILAAMQGNPGIALGNAYGSNITNIGLILGVTALINPVSVHSAVLRKELPILAAITMLAGFQLLDGQLSRMDALILLSVFLLLLAWTIYQGMSGKRDPLAQDTEQTLNRQPMPLGRALLWLSLGLALLVASSRVLVWGAVEIAQFFGVSDLVIGLTVVALGTSLPELASSVMAATKGEHDIALGNILGSNLFNTLAVVGLAGAINPMNVAPEVFSRDILTMSGFTLSLFLFGYGFRGMGRINRWEGSLLLTGFMVYTTYLVLTA